VKVQFAAIVCAVALSAAGSTIADAADTPASSPSAGTSLELNKLETTDKGCRAYVVVNNTSDVSYPAYKLDVILFQSDGVIGKRFALDLSPFKAQKKSVKLFDLDGVACDKIGSFLINEVMECKTDTGPSADCLQHLSTSTLTKVQISK
jgi:hypothetical protein